jgi:hypothetical protein
MLMTASSRLPHSQHDSYVLIHFYWPIFLILECFPYCISVVTVTGQRIGSPFGVDDSRSLLYIEVEDLLIAVYRRD